METSTSDWEQVIQRGGGWWSTHAATHAHAVHMCAAELKLVTFRSSACARKSRGGKDSERGREREEMVWTGSVLTLHFSLIHHLKQEGHWLWDESSDSCLHADAPRHANAADMQQQHSADCQAARLDPAPHQAEALLWNGTGPSLECTVWRPSHKTWHAEHQFVDLHVKTYTRRSNETVINCVICKKNK